MINMSYCMYENTALALQEVLGDMVDRKVNETALLVGMGLPDPYEDECEPLYSPLSESEMDARREIFELCKQIAEEFEGEDEDEDDEGPNPYALTGDELKRTEEHRTAGNQ